MERQKVKDRQYNTEAEKQRWKTDIPELQDLLWATVIIRNGKGQFSFQSLRKAMPKNAQITVQYTHLTH